jgi:hypothetical protein
VEVAPAEAGAELVEDRDRALREGHGVVVVLGATPAPAGCLRWRHARPRPVPVPPVGAPPRSSRHMLCGAMTHLPRSTP